MANILETLLSEKDMARLIKVNQKLKELGIEKTIKLPQICVIGDQSAGKSSLIEGLSRIKVPRAANCCTQCPLSINISSGERPDSPWKCVVHIEERYEFDKMNPTRRPSRANPMGPWSQIDFTSTEFKITHDKNEVCDLISAAQRAILNPDKNKLDFVPGRQKRLPAKDTVKFSPNAVRLDISEGNWPNLSFIDLPGVISNTDDVEDQYLVDLVKNLVKTYAKDPETINILTLPMTNDIANSNSLRLIQVIKAENRTMAVLTKPDRVTDHEERKQFLQKFLNQSESLFEHGFHVVMMPPDVKLSHQKAREIEMDYFEQDPWAGMKAELKSKLGVENVRSYIRELLFTKTRETLPENLRSIELRLEVIVKRLEQLPPPPEIARLPFIVFQHLAIFADNLGKLFSGYENTEQMTLRLEFNRMSKEFRSTVVNAKPTLLYQTAGERARLSAAKRKIEELQFRSSKKTGTEGSLRISSDEEDHAAAIQNETKPAINTPMKNNNICRFSLDGIRDLNRKYDNAGLPRQSYPQAIEEMMKLSVEAWVDLTDKFLDQVTKMVLEQVARQTGLVFREFRPFDFYNEISDWVLTYLRNVIHAELLLARSTCDVETTQPYTMDAEGMAERTEICLKDRVGRRDAWRSQLLQAESEATGAQKPRGRNTFEGQLPVDDYKTEVEMSATVRAYYEIASTRFTDSICQGLMARLFPVCGKKLAVDLQEYLNVTDPERLEQIAKWMNENPERERERESLIREQVQLTEGKKYIETVLTQGHIDEDGDEMDHDHIGGHDSDHDHSYRGHEQTIPFTPQKKPTTSQPPETPTPSRNKRTRPLMTAQGQCNNNIDDTDGDFEFLSSSAVDPPSTTKRLRRDLRSAHMTA